jgi:hypothetical protein
MFIKEYTVKKSYERPSKLGKVHQYTRNITVCVFRCDNCNTEFERNRGNMNPKRLNNNYFHVCKNCDSKKFAQKKGVERKKIWDLTASSDIPISQI